MAIAVLPEVALREPRLTIPRRGPVGKVQYCGSRRPDFLFCPASHGRNDVMSGAAVDVNYGAVYPGNIICDQFGQAFQPVTGFACYAIPTQETSEFSFLAVVNSTGTDTLYSNIFLVTNSINYGTIQVRHTTDTWYFYSNGPSWVATTVPYVAGYDVVIARYTGSALYLDTIANHGSANVTGAVGFYRLHIGSDSVAGTLFVGGIHLLSLWVNRCLSDVEVASLLRDPYQTVEPA